MGSLINDHGDVNEIGKKTTGLSFVYTYIPDSFCAVAKRLLDRVSLYTHKRTEISARFM